LSKAGYLLYATKLLGSIPHTTRILIIGTGAWYNSYSGVEDSNDEYATTLRMLGPMLRFLRHERGIDSYLLPLPLPTGPESLVQYEWGRFETKNRLAELILTPFEVTYLDFADALRDLKDMNPQIAFSDHLHWW